jgi:hypothetical protein
MIDSGRFRAPCASCDDVIPRNQVRVAEPCNDGRIPNAKYRYHHFECAMTQHPRLVQRILIDEAYDEGVLPDPHALLVELRDRIAAHEEKQPMPARRVLVLPEPRVDAMLAQLEANPDDRETLGVLADALTERCDPRGELIVLDLALDGAPGSEAQLERQRELRMLLLPRVCWSQKTRAETTWGVGYIRRVEVGTRREDDIGFDGYYISTISKDLWRHPSLRLLSELAVGDGEWLTSDLPALRVLEITAPRLPDLPALARLDKLVLRDMKIDRAVFETLARREAKLTTLDVSGCRVDDVLRSQLRELCQTLVG